MCWERVVHLDADPSFRSIIVGSGLSLDVPSTPCNSSLWKGPAGLAVWALANVPVDEYTGVYVFTTMTTSRVEPDVVHCMGVRV